MSQFTTGLTEATKKKLKEVVSNIRERLLEDIFRGLDRKFSFIVKDRSKLKLTPKTHYQFNVLKEWCEGPVRAEKGFEANIREAVKEAAYTLTNRLLIIKQLEARDIQKMNVVTGGKDSEGYKEFSLLCPQLCHGPDEGFRFLLKQVFDLVALELPGFFTDTEILKIMEIPGPTLLWVVDQLNQVDLEGAWTDDTTLGWVYQFWNDPDKKAIDNKLEGKGQKKGKVEAHELAHKTQLFTERYMVEWLLQNSLGKQWLAICQKNDWKPSAIDIIDRLEVLRVEWRKKLDTKEVSEDMPMPMESVEQEYWKYYINQDIPPKIIDSSPKSISDVKVLDPACGSGHFLVYAFDLLYEFYQEEARLIGNQFDEKKTVHSILLNNLHGIDIDPRAVQLSVASLLIKAKAINRECELDRLNLVSTDLGLSNLKDDDERVSNFNFILETEAGITSDKSVKLIDALKKVDYLGSLSKFDSLELLTTPDPINYQRLEDLKNQGSNIYDALDIKLSRFMQSFEQGDDLRVSSKTDPFVKGMRLIKLLNQKYDVVCTNPPYLGTAKINKLLADELIEDHEDAKQDLFAVFISRIFQLLKDDGIGAMVTMHSWMFLSAFQDFRERFLQSVTFSTIAHMGRGGGFLNWADFDKVMQTALFAFFKSCPKDEDDTDWFRLNMYRNIVKSYALLAQRNHYHFKQSRFCEIENSPMIYWWPEEFRQKYLESPKVKDIGNTKQGLATGNNNRHIRKWWEVTQSKISIIASDSIEEVDMSLKWYPYIKGAIGKKWFEPLSDIVEYSDNGKTLKYSISARYGRGATLYFEQGVSFSYIGTTSFFSRLREYKSIFDVSGSSIFTYNPQKTQVLLSSPISGYVTQSINPTINNQVGDIDFIPIFDHVDNWQDYYNEMKILFRSYFSSLENNIDFIYNKIDKVISEFDVLKTQNRINKKIFSGYSEDTQKLINKESDDNLEFSPKLKKDETSRISNEFTDIYLNGPYIYSQGQKKTNKSGEPERGKLQNLEELSHEFQLHPESIICIYPAVN